MTRETIQTRIETAPPTPIKWGAIFAGTVVALAVWAMLSSLGLALGLSSVDTPAEAQGRDDFGSYGAFTGIWGVMSFLVSLFVGGMVASGGAGILHKRTGVLQGLIVWALTLLASAWMLVSLVGALAGGTVSLGKAAMQAGGSAVAGVASGAAGADLKGAAKSAGLDAEAALQPINERLRAEGKPAITASQLESATKDIVQDAIRQGRFDRALLVSSIADKTTLSQADAEAVAQRVEQQVDASKAKVTQAYEGTVQKVEAGARKAADATGKAFWGIFGAFFLGAIAAIGGAVMGVTRQQRVWAERGRIAAPPATAVRPPDAAPLDASFSHST